MEQVLRFEDYPDHRLAVLLFRDVTNAKELRQAVISGSLPVDAAFINAELVPDLFALHLSAYKALVASLAGALKARSLHAELVFGLSGSKHIGEALNRFGISEACRHLLVAQFDPAPGDLEALAANVAGTVAPLEELTALAQAGAIKKAYKVAAEELEVGGLGDAIATRIAVRDC